MSFVLSKLAWTIFNPAMLLFMTLALGVVLLWIGSATWGRRLVTFSVVVTAVLMVFPVGTWLLQALENRFPRTALPRDVAGIIVLGGSAQPEFARTRQVVALNGSAERLLGFVRLARKYPDAHLVFTGGSGDPFDQKTREADIAAPILMEMGIPPARLVLERESRNTWENAVLSRKLIGPRAGGVWVLVTSARHMPRAMGAFRRAGWRVIAYPVDYGSETGFRWIGFRGPAKALRTLKTATREWVGLIWYWLRGRSDDVFPAPER